MILTKNREMWTFVKDMLSSDGGSAATVGGIFFLLVLIIYKGGRLWEKFSQHQEDLKEIKAHTDSISEIKGNHKVFENRIDKFESKIDKLSETVSLLNIAISTLTKSDPLTQTHSPLGLTEKGKRLVEEKGLQKMVHDNWNNINSFSNDIESKNPYDIQQFFIDSCLLHLEKLIGENNVDIVKRIAYNEGLSMASISRAIAVIIRDIYFKEHNINITEIDKHDPNKI